MSSDIHDKVLEHFKSQKFIKSNQWSSNPTSKRSIRKISQAHSKIFLEMKSISLIKLNL